MTLFWHSHFACRIVFGQLAANYLKSIRTHALANNLFLIGGKLNRPGFFNEAPDLTNLDNGDLIYQVDFRRIYATVLEDWLETDPGVILPGQFEKLNFVG